MSESDHYGVVMNRIMLTCFDWKHQRPGMTCLFDEAYHNVSFLNADICSTSRPYGAVGLPWNTIWYVCFCAGAADLEVYDY